MLRDVTFSSDRAHEGDGKNRIAAALRNQPAGHHRALERDCVDRIMAVTRHVLLGNDRPFKGNSKQRNAAARDAISGGSGALESGNDVASHCRLVNDHFGGNVAAVT